MGILCFRWSMVKCGAKSHPPVFPSARSRFLVLSVEFWSGSQCYRQSRLLSSPKNAADNATVPELSPLRLSALFLNAGPYRSTELRPRIVRLQVSLPHSSRRYLARRVPSSSARRGCSCIAATTRTGFGRPKTRARQGSDGRDRAPSWRCRTQARCGCCR